MDYKTENKYHRALEALIVLTFVTTLILRYLDYITIIESELIIYSGLIALIILELMHYFYNHEK